MSRSSAAAPRGVVIEGAAAWLLLVLARAKAGMRPADAPAGPLRCWENQVMTVLKVATCQFPVSADIEQNGSPWSLVSESDRSVGHVAFVHHRQRPGAWHAVASDSAQRAGTSALPPMRPV